MRQVLENLLRNALDAAPPEAPVEIVASTEPAGLVFTVRDRGPGIPPGDLERIFEPFVTGRVRGTGLGLAVARRIVDLHGGRISVRNRDGGGAEFRVVLP
jgi:two-component system sensor histidine kinase HydH